MPPINDPSQPQNSGEFTPPPTAKPVDKPALPNPQLKEVVAAIEKLAEKTDETKAEIKKQGELSSQDITNQTEQAKEAEKQQKTRDEKTDRILKTVGEKKEQTPKEPEYGPQQKIPTALAAAMGNAQLSLINSNTKIGAILKFAISSDKQKQMEIMHSQVSAKESMKEFGKALFPTFTKYGNQLGDYVKKQADNSPTVKLVSGIHKIGQILLSSSADAKKSAEKSAEAQRETGKPADPKDSKVGGPPAPAAGGAKMSKVEGIIAIMLAMPVFIFAMKMMSAGDLFKSLIVVGLILGALYLMAKIPASNIDKLALGIVLFGASLVVLAFGAAKMASIGLGTLLKIGLALLGLTLAAKAMSKIPTANLFKLALGLVLLSGAIIVLSYGVKTFAAIGWETLAKLGAALIGLGLAGFIMGKFSSQIMMGALAIAVLGASLVVLGFGVGMFEKIGWDTIAKMGVAIVALGLAAGIMGMPPQNLFIGIGTALLIGLGLAVLALGAGLNLPTPAIEAFGKVIAIVMDGTVKILDKFMEMGMAGPQILLGMGAAAVGIGLLGAALLAFSAMEAAGAVVGAVGGAISGVLGWFGGGEARMNSMQMLAAMTAFGASAESLSGGVTAIESLGNALRNFAAIDGDMPALKKILDFLKEFQSHDSSLFGSIMKVATAIGIVSGGASTASYEEPVAGKPQTAKKAGAAVKTATDTPQDVRPGDDKVRELMQKNVVVMTKLEENLKAFKGTSRFSVDDRKDLRKGGMTPEQINRAEQLEIQKYKSQHSPDSAKAKPISKPTDSVAYAPGSKENSNNAKLLKTQQDNMAKASNMNTTASRENSRAAHNEALKNAQAERHARHQAETYRPPLQTVNTSTVNNISSGGGGGGGGTTMIPMVMSSNNESTRNAVQVGFRPPG